MTEWCGGKYDSGFLGLGVFFTIKQPTKQTSFFPSNYIKDIKQNYYVIILFSLKIQKSVRGGIS